MRRYHATPAKEKPYTPPPATVDREPVVAPRAPQQFQQLAARPLELPGTVQIDIERDESGTMTAVTVRREGRRSPLHVAIERDAEGQMKRLVLGARTKPR